MKNAERPVSPIECEIINSSGDYTGLTKREHFAAMAMQGLLYTYDVSTVATCGVMVVKDAVDYADLLLAELEK
jgi:hypothetical protein